MEHNPIALNHQPFVRPRGQRVESSPDPTCDHMTRPLVGIFEIELLARSESVAQQIARALRKRFPTTLKFAWSGRIVQIAAVIPDNFAGDVWDFKDAIYNAIPDSLVRFTDGDVTFVLDPAKWDGCLRPVERAARAALQITGTCQCDADPRGRSIPATVCLCRSIGNLRPNTSEAWNGLRGECDGLLTDPPDVDENAAMHVKQRSEFVRAIRHQLAVGQAHLRGQNPTGDEAGWIDGETFFIYAKWLEKLRKCGAISFSPEMTSIILADLMTQHTAKRTWVGEPTIGKQPIVAAYPIPASTIAGIKTQER